MIDNIFFGINTYNVALFFILTPLYIWKYEKKKEEAKHVLFAGILAFVLGILLKQLFHLPRPYEIDGVVALAGQTISGSLPSVHTAITFAMATTVSLHQRRTGIFLFLIAAIIGFGRIAANVHYPIDIVVGAILGVGVSFLIEKIHVTR